MEEIMQKKIMLIDGNSIINRAFYAIPLLSNKYGEYTNAVYGFFNIFFKLYDEEKPDYIGVAFDLPNPTFRHNKYSEYKSNRKGMPDELASQVPILKEMLNKMNIGIFEFAGYEADDILGTLAYQSDKNGVIPVIISGDRDLLQIATDNIKIRIPKTKQGKTEVEDYYKNDVINKYGVTPEKFIDVKALMGDSSDNVPGVPSIGEKTAIKIIQQYESVENAISNAEKIKPKKAGENLITYKQQALMSKELVTIIKNVPIDFDIEKNKADNIFNNDAYEIFKKYEFKSMLSRFNTNKKQENIIEKTNYKYINDKKEAKEFLFELNPWAEIAYKIITENNNIIGISFFNNEIGAVFIDTNYNISEKDIIILSKDFFESDAEKITIDAKKDIVLLNKYGIKLNNIKFDAMIAGYILNATNSTYDYNDIAYNFLNINYKSEEELLGKGKSKKSVREIDKDEFLNFVCRQSEVPFKAKEIMLKKINENGQNELFFDIEMPLINVLADMEINGIKIDKNSLEVYRQELEIKLQQITKEIYDIAKEEFNINSPKQLGVILFEKMKLKGGKKTKAGWSTSVDILEKIQNENEIVKKILQYRTYSKLKSTYADGLLNVMDKQTNKIYSTFNQTITATGRISSTEPNLQNIPIKMELGHRLRKVFIPTDENYVFLDGDYSQIELRVLAHMSNDKTLIDAFNNGDDIHKITASQVFGVPFNKVTQSQRSNAKAVNFGIIYGISAFSLSEDLNISKKEAENYIDSYFTKYPNVKKYMNDIVEKAKEDGYTKTMFNRIRAIPELSSSSFLQRSFGERAAMNMPVQGSAADIIKIAMVKVHRKLKEENLRSKLILQIHDELLIETHIDEIDKVKEILKSEMENAVKLKVPLDIDIHKGINWYEAK